MFDSKHFIEKDHGVVANARCMELGEWISLKPSVLVLFPGSYGLLYPSMLAWVE